jgi:integrase
MSRPTSPLVSEVVAEYLILRKGMGKAPATVRQERSILLRFAARIAGATDPQMVNVTGKHVQDYLYGKHGLLNSGCAEGTYNNHLEKLRGLFVYAHARGYARSQLITTYNGFNRLKNPARERFQPAPAQIAEMMDSADDPRDRFFVALAVNTMGRAGELTTLRVGDMNMDNRRVTYTVYKTKQQDMIPMTVDLHEELTVWLRHYALSIGRPLHDDDYLIPAKVAGRIGRMQELKVNRIPRFAYEYRPDLPLTHAHRVVQQLLLATGRDDVKGEGIHTLRRGMARATFDMLAKKEGFEGALETVSAILHHSSVTMTETYLGVQARRMKRDKVLQDQPLLSEMLKQERSKNIKAVG